MTTDIEAAITGAIEDLESVIDMRKNPEGVGY